MALPSEQVIDSVEKLAMECRLKHISTIGINIDYYTSMKNSSNPTLQNIGQDMKFVSDRHKGIQMVLSFASRNHNYAFPGSHEQFLFTKIMIGWNQLYLPPATASFFPLFYAIPVPKTFIYRDEFNQIIKHANEAGFPQCWRLLEILKVFRNRRKNALEKAKIQSSSSSSSSSSANINIKYLRFSMLHMEIIFELYQITWTIAMITLISELFIHYRLMSRLISNMNRLFNHITNQYDRHG